MTYRHLTFKHKLYHSMRIFPFAIIFYRADRFAFQRHGCSVTPSQITGISTVYPKACSRERQRKRKSVVSLALCEGNPPITGGFPSQGASDTDIFSMPWPHHWRGDIYLAYYIPAISPSMVTIPPVAWSLHHTTRQKASLWAADRPSYRRRVSCPRPCHTEMWKGSVYNLRLASLSHEKISDI